MSGVTSPFADTPDTVNTHQYAVVAHNQYGQTTALSNLLAPPPPPSAPTNVTASWNPGYNAATVTWVAGANTQSFEIKRFHGTGSAQTQDWDMAGVASPFADTPDAVNTHQYEIIAHNPFGQASALLNLLGPPPPPDAPTHVVAQWVVNYTRASVTWVAGLNTDTFEVALIKTDATGPNQSNPIQVEDHPNIPNTQTLFEENLQGLISCSYQYQIIAHNRFGKNSSISGSLLVPIPSTPVPPGPPPGGPHHLVNPNQPPQIRPM